MVVVIAGSALAAADESDFLSGWVTAGALTATERPKENQLLQVTSKTCAARSSKSRARPRRLRARRRTSSNSCEIGALHFCKRLRISHFPPEGETGWALLDCGDVVVHALSEEMRQFYRLERLWPEAKAVQWQAEAATLARIDLPAPAEV